MVHSRQDANIFRALQAEISVKVTLEIFEVLICHNSMTNLAVIATVNCKLLVLVAHPRAAFFSKIAP